MPTRDPSIIIVEEDHDLATYIRAEFRLMGFEAYKVHSAEECLKKMDELANKVDVVAMDGKTATERGPMLIVNIKRRNSSIKVFVLAERNLEESKTRVLDYGADEFTVKPLSVQSIVEKVNRLLIEERLE